MSIAFASPQDAEDAFYDAIDDKDLSAMMAVWDDADDVACLLPMRPLAQGRSELQDVWRQLLGAEFDLQIQVHHLRWVEGGDWAVHYLQEEVEAPGQPQPLVYATNVYRRGPSGWRMLLHQNSPAPPPRMMHPDRPR